MKLKACSRCANCAELRSTMKRMREQLFFAGEYAKWALSYLDNNNDPVPDRWQGHNLDETINALRGLRDRCAEFPDPRPSAALKGDE